MQQHVQRFTRRLERAPNPKQVGKQLQVMRRRDESTCVSAASASCLAASNAKEDAGGAMLLGAIAAESDAGADAGTATPTSGELGVDI